MQESRETQTDFSTSRRESSSSTLFGGVSSEGLGDRLTQEKQDDIHTYNGGDHGSSKTNVQDDEFVLPELLPSFEMYENLHTNIPQCDFNTYFHENPPYYVVDSCNQSASSDVEPVGTNGSDTAGSENPVMNVDVEGLPLHSPITYVPNHDGTKGIPVEKIHTLPRINTGIAIELHVTKAAPKFGQRPKYESILKEYTCGDVIHGYFIVENKSTKKIKFDMVYLTLEGTVSSKTQSSFKARKKTKTFLRMVDLAASWSYNQEDVNTGEDLCGFFDSTDNTRFGLNNKRTLNPGDKRKKFFTFKVPNQLLDTTCKHGHFSHSLLPPTLGFDKAIVCDVDVAHLRLSESLGYGRLSERGSPLLLIDNPGNSKVSYSINAMIVGKDIKSGRICLMSEKTYSIRIVPFGFSSKQVSEEKYLKDMEDLGVTIAKRFERIEKILSKSRRAVPIQEEDLRETNDSYQVAFPGRKYLWNTVENDTAEKKNNSEEYNIESVMTYSKHSIFNKRFKSVLLKGVPNASSPQQGDCTSRMNSGRNGLIIMKVKPPNGSLPYWSPPLVQKKNAFSMKSKQNQQNWSNLQSLLSIEERETLENIQIKLVCVQAANSIPHDPPEVSDLQTELICSIESTEDCKPVNFHSSLLLNERKYNELKKTFQEISMNIEEYCNTFTDNQTKINSLLAEGAKASLRNKQLVFSDLMPSSMINDVQVLAHMELNIAVIRNALESKLFDATDVNSHSSSSSSSISSMIPRASRSIKNITSSNNGRSISSHIKSNKWNRISTTEYTKTLSLNVKFKEIFKETLVPNFQNCLCSRSYFLRIKLHFDKGAGTSQIDIPIKIKNCHTQQ